MLHGDQAVPKLCNVADEETTTCNKKCRGLVEYIGLKPGRPHLSSTLPPRVFQEICQRLGQGWGRMEWLTEETKLVVYARMLSSRVCLSR